MLIYFKYSRYGRWGSPKTPYNSKGSVRRQSSTSGKRNVQMDYKHYKIYPYQGFLDKADSIYSLPFSGNGKDSDMANLPTVMELEQVSTQRTLSRTPSPQSQLTPCEQLKFNKAQLAKMEVFRKCKQTCVDTLRQMPDHYPDEPFYRRALTELQDIEETMAIAVSDIDSYDPCTIPGCSHHEKAPSNSPIKFTQTTPKSNAQNINPCKRKDNSNFEYPPQRKTTRKIVLDFPTNEEINLSPNKFELPQRFNSNNLENPGSPVIEKNPTSPVRKTEISSRIIRPIRVPLKTHFPHQSCYL
ncbi:hypothetical protein TNCV_2281531 [Trichonephila clavipes]|nr:hypothetical protein TNCV_2281531 [Trichonephila clavipes]